MLRRFAWLVGGLSIAAVSGGGCSDEGELPPPRAGATVGSGGSAGGGGSGERWAKPTCGDPDAPLGAVPSARSDTAGALASDGETFMVFGGDEAIVVCGDFTPDRIHVADTWLLDVGCGAWTQLSPPVAPSPRSRHAIAQDPARNQAVLFGGRFRENNLDSGPYTQLGDVWAFSFETLEWTEIVPTNAGPSPRSNTAAVVAGDELIVFGGNTSTNGAQFTPLQDTWALDLTTNTWREIPAASPPPPRLFHSATYDPDQDRVFITSGGDEQAFLGPFLADAWVLDLATETWTELPTDGIAPLDYGRIKGGLTYRRATDDAPGSLIRLLGHDAGDLGNRNDVQRLALDASTWTQPLPGDVYNAPPSGQCDFPADFVVVDPDSPERRMGFAMGTVPDGGAAVIFGGDSDCGRLNDTWWFDSGTNQWTIVRESLPGLICQRTGSPDCSSLCE